MSGSKASFLTQRCTESAIDFVRFDYRGCGLSSGDFRQGTIGAWLEDSLAVFDHVTQGTQIVVGSSMGGWLGLLLAQARPERVKAFIGIAAAPDFTEALIWNKLSPTQRETLLREGEIYEDNAPPDHRAPLTLKLIEEARQHLFFDTHRKMHCPARLLQGMKDTEVPPFYTQKIVDNLDAPSLHIIQVENGDHRLSKPEDLDLLWQTIKEFI